MFEGENGSVLAGIAGIVALVGIDLVTKRTYRVDAKKDSITVTPAAEDKKPQPQEQSNQK